jgi:PAS domain-containing protein
MVIEEDRDLVRQQAYDILSEKIPQSIEHRIIRKDGVMLWVESIVVPDIDRNSNLISYTGIVRDITKRKKTEGQIQKERLFAESIVETVREPLIVIDKNQLVISANRWTITL